MESLPILFGLVLCTLLIYCVVQIAMYFPVYVCVFVVLCFVFFLFWLHYDLKKRKNKRQSDYEFYGKEYKELVNIANQVKSHLNKKHPFEKLSDREERANLIINIQQTSLDEYVSNCVKYNGWSART